MITERERILAHLLNETMTEGDNAYNNFDAAIDLCRKVRDAWQEEEIVYNRDGRRIDFDCTEWLDSLSQLEARL